MTGNRLKGKVPTNSQSFSTSSGKILEDLDTVKLLGVDIDTELSFSNNDRICKKLAQRTGILNKIKYCLPLRQRILYYNSTIRPL